MRTDRPRGALLISAILAVVPVVGCGATADDTPVVPVTATGSLEQIASRAACEPDLQTGAAELRQANCRTADGTYVLVTFATDRGQREWINEAKDYGGSYLVGRKWVAVGDAKAVAGLRARLGGNVETGTSHHHQGSGGGGTGMPGMPGMDLG